MNESETLSPEQGSPGLVIELAKPEDAEAIANIQRNTWLDTYPNQDLDITKEDVLRRFDGEDGQEMTKRIDWFKRSIESSDNTHSLFVARSGNKVVGYIMPSPINGQQRIGALYILPETQGKGVGSKLLQKAIDWYGREKDIFLHVASYNDNAIKFYKHFGFDETGQTFNESDSALNEKIIPEIEMVLRAKR